jgi:hypothetical protein
MVVVLVALLCSAASRRLHIEGGIRNNY